MSAATQTTKKGKLVNPYARRASQAPSKDASVSPTGSRTPTSPTSNSESAVAPLTLPQEMESVFLRASPRTFYPSLPSPTRETSPLGEEGGSSTTHSAAFVKQALERPGQTRVPNPYRQAIQKQLAHQPKPKKDKRQGSPALSPDPPSVEADPSSADLSPPVTHPLPPLPSPLPPPSCETDPSRAAVHPAGRPWATLVQDPALWGPGMDPPALAALQEFLCDPLRTRVRLVGCPPTAVRALMLAPRHQLFCQQTDAHVVELVKQPGFRGSPRSPPSEPHPPRHGGPHGRRTASLCLAKSLWPLDPEVPLSASPREVCSIDALIRDFSLDGCAFRPAIVDVDTQELCLGLDMEDFGELWEPIGTEPATPVTERRSSVASWDCAPTPKAKRPSFDSWAFPWHRPTVEQPCDGRSQAAGPWRGSANDSWCSKSTHTNGLSSTGQSRASSIFESAFGLTSNMSMGTITRGELSGESLFSQDPATLQPFKAAQERSRALSMDAWVFPRSNACLFE